jgi:predicted O-methyltransferase YrrM
MAKAAGSPVWAPDPHPTAILKECAQWFADKEFSSDWFVQNIPNWIGPLAKFRDGPCEVLEIGSFEGRSAVFLLEYLRRCKLTCIDPFYSSDIERRFASNTAHYSERLEVLKEVSVPALDKLRRAQRQYQVIYIDGSHRRDDVLADSILAWPMLSIGGLLIWDDRGWKTHLPSDERPGHAIDLFCAMFRSCFQVRHWGYQVIVEKTDDWPKQSRAAQLLRWPSRRIGRLLKRLHKSDPKG